MSPKKKYLEMGDTYFKREQYKQAACYIGMPCSVINASAWRIINWRSPN